MRPSRLTKRLLAAILVHRRFRRRRSIRTFGGNGEPLVLLSGSYRIAQEVSIERLGPLLRPSGDAQSSLSPTAQHRLVPDEKSRAPIQLEPHKTSDAQASALQQSNNRTSRGPQ